MRRTRLSAVFLLLGAVACTPPSTEILWDEYGVPHIYAATNEDLFRLYGWAQMNNHADLILRLYGESRGRAAEYWGEESLSSDWWVHTMGVPGRAADWYDEQDPEMRSYLDAFATGMNEWAEANRAQIDRRVRRVLPVQPVDVLAHLQRTLHFTFMASPDMIPRDFEAAGLEMDLDAERLAGRVGGLPPGAGSNAWVIGPDRAAGGHAMLLANPHLPWDGRFTFMEAQLTSPDVRSYGAVLVGLPMLGISFNQDLGWTHTVNTLDGADLYLLELDETGYRIDDEHRDFTTRAELLRVRGESASRELWLTVRESVHGPVVGEKAGEAVALRVAGLDASQLPRQSWEMLTATNIDEFESALASLQLPMFTTLYADRDGNILHVFNGRVPYRETGDFTYWDGLVGGGSTSTLWDEVHGYSELPRVQNPPTGWLQNANDPPWTTTFPPALDPGAFPDYMAPRGMHFRAQRSAELLRSDDEISFDEMVEYKHSTRVALADRLLDDLMPLARTRGSPMARNAADVLERWDRKSDATSEGTVLFVAWVQELARRSGGFDGIFATSWDQDRPLETPDGLANSDIAVSALEAAAVSVQDQYGMLTAPFGDVYRIRRDDLDLPGNGFGDPLGVFRAAWYGEGRFGLKTLNGGDSYVAAVEFSTPVRASAIIGYGNASQPGSPHRTDQLRMFAGKELRQVWLERRDVEEHTRQRQVF